MLVKFVFPTVLAWLRFRYSSCGEVVAASTRELSVNCTDFMSGVTSGGCYWYMRCKEKKCCCPDGNNDRNASCCTLCGWKYQGQLKCPNNNGTTDGDTSPASSPSTAAASSSQDNNLLYLLLVVSILLVFVSSALFLSNMFWLRRCAKREDEEEQRAQLQRRPSPAGIIVDSPGLDVSVAVLGRPVGPPSPELLQSGQVASGYIGPPRQQTAFSNPGSRRTSWNSQRHVEVSLDAQDKDDEEETGSEMTSEVCLDHQVEANEQSWATRQSDVSVHLPIAQDDYAGEPDDPSGDQGPPMGEIPSIGTAASRVSRPAATAKASGRRASQRSLSNRRNARGSSEQERPAPQRRSSVRSGRSPARTSIAPGRPETHEDVETSVRASNLGDDLDARLQEAVMGCGEQEAQEEGGDSQPFCTRRSVSAPRPSTTSKGNRRRSMDAAPFQRTKSTGNRAECQKRATISGTTKPPRRSQHRKQDGNPEAASASAPASDVLELTSSPSFAFADRPEGTATSPRHQVEHQYSFDQEDPLVAARAARASMQSLLSKVTDMMPKAEDIQRIQGQIDHVNRTYGPEITSGAASSSSSTQPGAQSIMSDRVQEIAQHVQDTSFSSRSDMRASRMSRSQERSARGPAKRSASNRSIPPRLPASGARPDEGEWEDQGSMPFSNKRATSVLERPPRAQTTKRSASSAAVNF